MTRALPVCGKSALSRSDQPAIRVGPISAPDHSRRRLQVIAREVQLVQVVLLGRMKRRLCRRQRKNEPAVTGVHRGAFPDIAKESAVAFRVLDRKSTRL